MINGALGVFSDGQTITADADSTHSIDLRKADVGMENTNLHIYVFQDVLNTAVTGDTLTIHLQDSADDSSFATVMDILVEYDFGAAPSDKLQVKVGLPKGLRRYVQLNYDVTKVGAPSADYTAFIA